jgi:hypothetical protein
MHFFFFFFSTSSSPSPLSICRSLSFDALASLHSQVIQAAAAAPHARLRREVGGLAERYLSGAAAAKGGGTSTGQPPPPPSVHALAAAAGVPPALLMRRLVEAALPTVGWSGGKAGGGGGGGGAAAARPAPTPTPSSSTPHPTPTAVLRAPAATLLQGGGGGPDTATPSASFSLPHPAAPRLAADAAAAAAADTVFSPRADAARHAMGAEAEALLRSRLRALGAGHWSEAALRAGGYVCTPDARLAVPFLLDGTPIHWVDSKAAFGSPRLHGAQLRDQYGRYVNRYGPGLVVYWGGFDPAILALGGGSGGGGGGGGGRGGGSGGAGQQPPPPPGGEGGGGALGPSTAAGLPPRGTVLVRDRLPRPGDPGLVRLRCLGLPGRAAVV